MEAKSNSNLINNRRDFLLYKNVYASIKSNSLFNYLNFDYSQLNTYISYLFNTQLPKLEERNNNIVSGEDKKQNLYESLSIMNSGILQATGLTEQYLERNNTYFKDYELDSQNPFLINKNQVRNEFIDYKNQTNIELIAKNIQWSNRLAKLAKYARNDVLYKYTNGDEKLTSQFSKLYTRLMLSPTFNDNSKFNKPLIDTFMEEYNRHLQTKEPLNREIITPIYEVLKKEIQDHINYDEKYRGKYRNPAYALETFYTYVSTQQAMEKLYEFKESYTTELLKEYSEHKQEYDQKGYKLYTYTDKNKEKIVSKILEISIPEYNAPFSLHTQGNFVPVTCRKLGLIINHLYNPPEHFSTPLIYKMKPEQITKLTESLYNPFKNKNTNFNPERRKYIETYYKDSDLVKKELQRQKDRQEIIELNNEKRESLEVEKQKQQKELQRKNKKHVHKSAKNKYQAERGGER